MTNLRNPGKFVLQEFHDIPRAAVLGGQVELDFPFKIFPLFFYSVTGCYDQPNWRDVRN